MGINIGMTDKQRETVAKGLSKLLADSYSLYLKTHNFHWNVTGSMFNSLHTMFETQYTEQWGGFTQALAPDGPDGAHDAGLRAAFDAHFSAGPDAWADDKLEIILAGIEARLAAADARKTQVT